MIHLNQRDYEAPRMMAKLRGDGLLNPSETSVRMQQLTLFFSGGLRIPVHADHRSGMKAITIPG